MKATAIAPSNIAFIKYWGRKDEILRLPENGSISMNLSNLTTTTTVEFDKKYKEDKIIINNQEEENSGSRAIRHLDRVRSLAKINLKAKVVTNNNFPTGTGLSSSASGFAALTVAGSACRSIPDGFVEWLDGNTDETSYGVSLYPESYWDIADVVAVVSKNKKEVSTTEGQKLANSSPFFPVRLGKIKEKINL